MKVREETSGAKWRRRRLHAQNGQLFWEGIPGIRYDMNGFMEGVSRDISNWPTLEERNIADSDCEEPGELSSIAAKMLINMLYPARMVRFDLLQLATPLARHVSRWRRACDNHSFVPARLRHVLQGERQLGKQQL